MMATEGRPVKVEQYLRLSITFALYNSNWNPFAVLYLPIRRDIQVFPFNILI